MENPIRLTDQSSWYPETVLEDLAKQGKITEQEQYKALDKIRSESSEAKPQDALLREYLQSLRYDGVVYLNRYEILRPENNGIDSEDRGRIMTETARLQKLPDADFKKEYPYAKDSYMVFDPKQIKIIDDSKQP